MDMMDIRSKGGADSFHLSRNANRIHDEQSGRRFSLGKSVDRPGKGITDPLSAILAIQCVGRPLEGLARPMRFWTRLRNQLARLHDFGTMPFSKLTGESGFSRAHRAGHNDDQ